MAQFIAYHGVSAAEHQGRVNSLFPAGFRPISLSVSGDPGDARYAAVWVQRQGPAAVAVHGLTGGQYQSRFDQLTAQGFSPILLSATGAGENATFTALFEQGVPEPGFARHNLRWDPESDPNTITHENRRAFEQGFVPRGFAVYGTTQAPQFGGVWIRNDANLRWSWWWADAGTYQLFFDALVRGEMRPAWVGEATDGRILALFRDDQIGQWSARHGLTAEQYQAEFNLQTARGLMPIVVQAGGAGAGTRYAAIFATTDTPVPRAWSVTGQPAAAVADLDAVVRQFMTVNGIRAGAVACGRGLHRGIVLSRGYTWAEAGYPKSQPGTLFRIASVSKLFTAACIDRLVAAGRLAWNTPAFPFLGITGALLPSQTPDPLTARITVEQLVRRTSGLREHWDGGNDLRSIAVRLGISTTPSRDQLVRYMYGEPLAFAPGTSEHYSNIAFTVLTSVIEAASGRSYRDYLQSDVLGSMGIADIHVATTVHASRPGEVAGYDDPGIGLSWLQPRARVWEPNAYGGSFTLENGEGSGGLVTSAITIARVIARHAVWDVGPRQVAARYGILDGTTAGAVSRGDGLDFGFVFNRRVSSTEHDRIRTAIDRYLDVHGGALT